MADVLTDQEKALIAEAVKAAIASDPHPAPVTLSVSGVLSWVKANPTWVVVGLAAVTIACKHLGIASPISYDELYQLELLLGVGTGVHTIKNA